MPAIACGVLSRDSSQDHYNLKMAHEHCTSTNAIDDDHTDSCLGKLACENVQDWVTLEFVDAILVSFNFPLS